MRDRNKTRGSLIAGAAGDALGYAVEFSRLKSIKKQYGSSGITGYDLINGIAEISDDTQMTLFTAEGLLLGSRDSDDGSCDISAIYRSYQDWYETQTEPFIRSKKHYTKLAGIPELYSRRAPGITCLDALRGGKPGSIAAPVNNSKGCGGVMRVAPVGLFYAGTKSDMSIRICLPPNQPR